MILGLPLGSALLPVEDQLRKVLSLQTPFGDYARESAAKLLPSDHVLIFNSPQSNGFAKLEPQPLYNKRNQVISYVLYIFTRPQQDNQQENQQENLFIGQTIL